MAVEFKGEHANLENAMNKQICGLLMAILTCIFFLAACSNPEPSQLEPVIPGLVNTLAVQTLVAQGITPLISTPETPAGHGRVNVGLIVRW